jgi:hypothetical protein
VPGESAVTLKATAFAMATLVAVLAGGAVSLLCSPPG